MAYVQIAALAVAAAIGASGAWWTRDKMADAVEARMQREAVEQRAAWDRAARESSEEQRRIEQARQAAITQEAEHARREAENQAARAAELDAVAGQLRAANGRLLDNVARLAAYADRSSGPASAPVGSASASGPGLVLAELYGSVDAEARELAQAYDAARRAGLVCERGYDAVRGAL